MNDLGDWSKDLINSAQGGYDPSSVDRQRNRAALFTTVAAGGAVLSTATAAKAGGVLLGLKLGAGALIVGAGAAAVTLLPLPSAETQVAPHAVQAVPARAVVAPRVEALEEAPVEVVAEPEKVVAPQRKIVAREKPALKASLAEEVSLLQKARAALQAGDIAVAQRNVTQHAQKFPNGALSLERAGLAVMVACKQNAEAGRSAARDFLASYGKTPVAAAVRSNCGVE